MKIINIRGTSGSGKSTLVKNIMARYKHKLTIRNPDPAKKRPMGYLVSNDNKKWLAIVGHYEIACGGCDTIKTYAEVMAKVTEAYELGYDVLFEGAVLSTLWKPFVELYQGGYPLEIISLNTPLKVCLESVMMRRREKSGDDAKPLNPKTTTGKFNSTKSTHAKITAAGVPGVWASREEAEQLICERLGLNDQQAEALRTDVSEGQRHSGDPQGSPGVG